MENIIKKMTSLYPVSDKTIQELKKQITYIHFPKKHLLVQADRYNGSAFFIEKGITRSFWLVNNKKVTTSFATKEVLYLAWMNCITGKTVRSLLKH